MMNKNLNTMKHKMRLNIFKYSLKIYLYFIIKQNMF